MSPRELGKFLGMSHVTVIRHIQSGKIKATQKRNGNNKKPCYDISTDEAARLKIEKTGGEAKIKKTKAEKEKSREATMNRKLDNPEVDPNPDREIKVGGGMTRVEAERIIKQEEAIRRQRENLKEAGELISGVDIKQMMQIHYRALVDGMEELIDGWCISFTLDPKQSARMLAEWKLKLDSSWSNIKRGLRQS